MGLGVGLIYSTARFFNLALAGICSLSANFLFTLFIKYDFNIWLSIIFALMGSTLIGAALEFLIFRPLRRAGGSRLVLLMVSLGILTLILGSSSICFGDESKIVRVGNKVNSIMIFGASITTIQIINIIITSFLCVFLWLVLRYTNFGKSIRSISNDIQLATIVGIKIDKVLLQTNLLGSFLVSTAGLCTSFDTGLNPLMGFEMLLPGVVAAIIGGIKYVQGIVFGGILIGIARNFGVWKLPTQWQDVITLIILLAFLFFRSKSYLRKKKIMSQYNLF